MKSVKYFYTFKIDHQICLAVKREQNQLHQIIIFDLKEISAEAGLWNYQLKKSLMNILGSVRQLTEQLSFFFVTACHVTCLKTPHILASNLYFPSLYHFVHPFYQLINLVYTRTNRYLLRYSSILILY